MDLEAFRQRVSSGILTLLVEPKDGCSFEILVPRNVLERFARITLDASEAEIDRLRDKASADVAAGLRSGGSDARRPHAVACAILLLIALRQGRDVLTESPLRNVAFVLDPDITKPLAERGGLADTRLARLLLRTS